MLGITPTRYGWQFLNPNHMTNKTLELAKANIDQFADYCGFRCDIVNSNLYIEFANGRSFRLADEEVVFHACEFLESVTTPHTN